jgi:hypothetical protein
MHQLEKNYTCAGEGVINYQIKGNMPIAMVTGSEPNKWG